MQLSLIFDNCIHETKNPILAYLFCAYFILLDESNKIQHEKLYSIMIWLIFEVVGCRNHL